ncbi:Histone-lysine N-methyltransferase ATX2 [Spatholobus suberectus]|nr:Histone-lysine N-methyltransferase ATX2 [Spatholobus suberectus]
MEGRAENSNDTKIPKKSRSLDLKSLYKSKLTEENAKKNLKRIGSSSGGGDEKRKRKKARKEVSLSSLENGDGSSELKLGVSQRLSSSSMLNRVSFSVGDDDVQIPKRKRSFAGRKKSEFGQASNLVEQPSHKIGSGDEVPKLGSDDLGRGGESLKIKHNKEFDEFKENRNSDSNSVQHFKENGDHATHSVVNSGDSSLTKPRRKNRKRKALAVDRTKVSKEAEPLVSSSKISDDLQEDEQENLEENAARMLSSRFDPSCTGFSIKGSNGLSFFQSSSQSIVNRSLKSQSGSESASADTAGRVLRPRKQYKNKGNSRKRRHFYEILLGDVDAYWVLNRRIKIFWPLDQSWYYGLVDNYNEASKHYHIKYDDRDEEWVNLHTERFKLLLLRSEVPGNAKGERALTKRRSSNHQKGSKSRKERQRTKENTEDDHCGGSSMDSEPIISWLARSSHRLRSSSFQGIKKQKTSVTLPNTMSSILYDDPVTAKGHLAKSSLRGVKNNLSCDSVSQDKLSDDFMEKSSLQSATRTKDGKQPIVYFRRRIRKPAPISPHISEENHAIISASGSVSFDHMFGGVENMKNRSVGRVEVEGPLCFTYKAGVSKIFWDMESASFKFGLNFPMCLVLNESFQSENLWMLYTVLLLQYGSVMTKWPRVCLEMLFVDNVVGLRFFLFEGCLKTAAAFVSFVLRVFHQPAHRGKYVDLQFPCTSIGFKFSSVHVIKKPLVFEFYNFSRVKNSKWMCLDSKLKRHCMLSKQLHLSECTYDNIQALQNGSSGFSITSISGSSSVKVMPKRSRPGINIMGVSKVSTQADTHQYSDAGERKLPPFALSFAAAPTFFLCLHLKLLMEQSATRISFCHQAPIYDQEDPGLTTKGCTSTDDCSNRNSEIILRKDMETLSNGGAVDGGSCADSDHPSTCSDQILSQNYQNIGLHGAGTSISHGSERLGTTHLPEWQSHHLVQELGSLPSSSLIREDKVDDGSHSFIGDLSIQIPAVDQFEKPGDGDLRDVQHSPDFFWNINEGVIPSSNPTAHRSSWYRNRNSSLSLGFQSNAWSDGKADSLYNDFSNGPKKPRTQVSYTVPSAAYEFSSRQRNHQKGLPHKRIRKASEKKSSDVARGPEKNFECLSCGANVLITLGDKGWRESGAYVVLELFDHNEWRLSVKLLGITRYSYKAHQFLQPGSTNRYTHAMMWKGGKDWILEFPDRSQWALFKEMHEECYNRNIRAASVKNIPIPGVHLIEENADNGCQATFVRSCKYFQQVETDVEMALDPSRVLYDMIVRMSSGFQMFKILKKTTVT